MVKYTTQKRYLRGVSHAVSAGTAADTASSKQARHMAATHPRSTKMNVKLGRCRLQLRSRCQSSAVNGCVQEHVSRSGHAVVCALHVCRRCFTHRILEQQAVLRHDSRRRTAQERSCAVAF